MKIIQIMLRAYVINVKLGVHTRHTVAFPHIWITDKIITKFFLFINVVEHIIPLVPSLFKNLLKILSSDTFCIRRRFPPSEQETKFYIYIYISQQP